MPRARRPFGDDDKIVSLRPSMDQLPLDEAFADGGWRMMARDRAYDTEHFEDDPLPKCQEPNQPWID